MSEFEDGLDDETEEIESFDDIRDEVRDLTSEMDFAVAAWHEDGRWTTSGIADTRDIGVIIDSLKAQQTNGGAIAMGHPLGATGAIILGTLLDELERIKTTKMSEEEAALARQAAYAKYNAAIQQSGGLAEANFYTEKTQIELLQIEMLFSCFTIYNLKIDCL